MNYLDLCKRLRQEAGYSGSGPASVNGQSGEMKRVVSWIKEAWLDIQRMSSYWRFMLNGFQVSLAVGESSVSLANDYKMLTPDTVVLTRADGSKTYPSVLRPEQMRQLIRERVEPASYPRFVSVDDAGEMTVFPVCGEAVSIAGDYYRTPVELVENTDEPHCREEYHMAIVWHALLQSGSFDESSNVFARASNNFATLYSQMCLNERPRLKKSEPVA